MEEELSATSISWCWVIEALARSQQLGTAILYELLSKAPPLPGKPGKEARDSVALRCLEEFFGPSSGSVDNHPTSLPSKARFDNSDSCEDVLQRLLRESSGSDVRKDASDELKCDVHLFIKQKKASLPRSTLEQVKIVMVEGNNPVAASLKELNELALPNQSVLTIPSSGVDSDSLPTVTENGNGGQSVQVGENGNLPEHGTNGQTSLPNGNLQHSDGATSDDQVQEADRTANDHENHEPPVKKLRLDNQDGVQSQQQPSVTCGSSGLSNAANDGVNHQCPKASQKHDGDSNNENLGEQGKVDAVSDIQLQTSRDNDGHHSRETDLAKKMLAFLSSQNVLPDESLAMTQTEVNLCMNCNKGGELLVCGANTCPLAFHESCLGCSASLDDEGKFYCPFCAYSRAISEYVRAKEKVSLARKELSLFIGGRNSYPVESDSGRESGDNANQQRKSGDVNETAELRTSVNLVTEAANCSQLRSLNMKPLVVSALPAMVPANSGSALEENVSQKKQNEYVNETNEPKSSVNVVTEIANHCQLRSSKKKQQDVSEVPASVAANSGRALEEDVDKQRQNEHVNEEATQPKTNVNVVSEVSNRRQLRSSKKKQQEASSLPAGVAANAFIAAARSLTSEDREGAEIIAQLAGDTIKILNQGQAHHNVDGGNSSHGTEKTIKTSQKLSNLKRKKVDAEDQATEHQADAHSESIIDSDEESEDGKDTANHYILAPRPPREIPQSKRSRRKKVPWTAEEEAMLKKGVERFVTGDNTPIPWKTILETGGSVFQVGRTPMDLKDKWTNILRASPKIK